MSFCGSLLVYGRQSFFLYVKKKVFVKRFIGLFFDFFTCVLFSQTELWINNIKIARYQKNLAHNWKTSAKKGTSNNIFKIFHGHFFAFTHTILVFFTYKNLMFTEDIFSKFSRALWVFHGQFLIFFYAHSGFFRKDTAKMFTEGSHFFTYLEKKHWWTSFCGY